MRKICLLPLVLTFAFVLTACGDKTSGGSDSTTKPLEVSSETKESTTPASSQDATTPASSQDATSGDNPSDPDNPPYEQDPEDKDKNYSISYQLYKKIDPSGRTYTLNPSENLWIYVDPTGSICETSAEPGTYGLAVSFHSKFFHYDGRGKVVYNFSLISPDFTQAYRPTDSPSGYFEKPFSYGNYQDSGDIAPYCPITEKDSISYSYDEIVVNFDNGEKLFYKRISDKIYFGNDG